MASDLARIDELRIHREADHLLKVTLAVACPVGGSDTRGTQEAAQWIYLRSGGLGGETG